MISYTHSAYIHFPFSVLQLSSPQLLCGDKMAIKRMECQFSDLRDSATVQQQSRRIIKCVTYTCVIHTDIQQLADSLWSREGKPHNVPHIKT